MRLDINARWARLAGLVTSFARADSLKMKAIRGSLWTLLGYGASQALRLASNLVLTRLLFPAAFGQMAIVNVFVQGLQMFSDIGIGSSIVRHKRGEDPVFLNTVWTIQIIRGVILWAVTCALAGPTALLYGKPELAPFIVVAGLGAAISGLNSTSLFTLSRRLSVGRLTLFDLATQMLGIAAMIAWALASPSVWALVVGGLVTAVVRAVWSHRLSAHGNRPAWDAEARAELLSFGRVVFLSTGVLFLANQSDRMILGKYVSMEALGVYSVAWTLSRLGTNIAQTVMGRVLFPALSKLYREDPEGAAFHYQRLRIVVDAVTVLGALVLLAAGPMLVRLLYDERYHEAGWMLQILALQSAFDIMRAPAAWLLLAAGKPGYSVWAGVSRIAVLWIGLPLAFMRSGIDAALWLIVLSGVPSLAVFSEGVGSVFPRLRAGEWVGNIVVLVVLSLAYLALR